MFLRVYCRTASSPHTQKGGQQAFYIVAPAFLHQAAFLSFLLRAPVIAEDSLLPRRSTELSQRCGVDRRSWAGSSSHLSNLSVSINTRCPTRTIVSSNRFHFPLNSSQRTLPSVKAG